MSISRTIAETAGYTYYPLLAYSFYILFPGETEPVDWDDGDHNFLGPFLDSNAEEGWEAAVEHFLAIRLP